MCLKYHTITLAKQGAKKNMSEISYNNLLLSSHEIAPVLEKTKYKELEKRQICKTFLFKVIYIYTYKLHPNSWNTTYAQRNV